MRRLILVPAQCGNALASVRTLSTCTGAYELRCKAYPLNNRMHLTGYSGLCPLPLAGDAGRYPDGRASRVLVSEQ